MSPGPSHVWRAEEVEKMVLSLPLADPGDIVHGKARRGEVVERSIGISSNGRPLLLEKLNVRTGVQFSKIHWLWFGGKDTCYTDQRE